jgi:hypothetical protein
MNLRLNKQATILVTNRGVYIMSNTPVHSRIRRCYPPLSYERLKVGVYAFILLRNWRISAKHNIWKILISWILILSLSGLHSRQEWNSKSCQHLVCATPGWPTLKKDGKFFQQQFSSWITVLWVMLLHIRHEHLPLIEKRCKLTLCKHHRGITGPCINKGVVTWIAR